MSATTYGRPALPGITFAAVLAASAMPAAAQQWHAGAHAGRIHSSIDPSMTAQTLAVGLRYDDAASGLRLSIGVPARSDDALQAGAVAWSRLAVRGAGFVAGIDLAASGFVFRERATTPRGLPGNPLVPGAGPVSGHALAGQVLPVVGYEGAGVHIHARTGSSHAIARAGTSRSDRTVHMADLQLTLFPARGAALLPAVRIHDGDDVHAATRAGLTAVVAGTLGSVRGGIGRWLNVDGVGTPWSAGATLVVHPRARLEADARRETYDPLHMSAPQTSWSIGAVVRVGGRGTPAAPVPAAYVDGRATIRLPASATASPPSIAGDFTDWKPVPMVRSGDAWTYTAPLPPGVYHYAFVAADGTWFVPESTPGRRDDGMGGHVAVLVVS